MNLFNIRRTFEMQKSRGWTETYWCIDLHGTIIPSGKDSSDPTDRHEFYPGALEVLRWLSKREDIMLILWTSTPLDRLVETYEWLQSQWIEFTYINQNPHAKSTPRSDFAHKFYMSIILDDRAGFDPQYDWILIAKEIEMTTGEKILMWSDNEKTLLVEGVRNTTSALNDLITF